MKFIILFCLLSALLLPGSILGADMPSGLRDMWESYFKKIDQEGALANYGRIIGKISFPPTWQYRRQCYEVYFASQEQLARSIYGLAISSGDIKTEISLERFIKGVQGFHYDMEQVCAWIAKINDKTMTLYTSEERKLISWLFEDRVIVVSQGEIKNGGLVNHFLGASPGARRNLSQNLTHERLHVMWDEDIEFRQQGCQSWQNLSPDERRQVYASLPGYSKDNETQIIEEWWIRFSEKLPQDRIDLLLGSSPQ